MAIGIMLMGVMVILTSFMFAKASSDDAPLRWYNWTGVVLGIGMCGAGLFAGNQFSRDTKVAYETTHTQPVVSLTNMGLDSRDGFLLLQQVDGHNVYKYVTVTEQGTYTLAEVKDRRLYVEIAEDVEAEEAYVERVDCKYANEKTDFWIGSPHCSQDIIFHVPAGSIIRDDFRIDASQ